MIIYHWKYSCFFSKNEIYHRYAVTLAIINWISGRQYNVMDIKVKVKNLSFTSYKSIES